MDNKTLEQLINQEYIKNLSSFILSLSSLEFVTSGTIAGYLISTILTTQEQNSVGNWLELVGQIVLTFNAQGSSNLPPSPKQFIDLEKRVKELESKLKIN